MSLTISAADGMRPDHMSLTISAADGMRPESAIGIPDSAAVNSLRVCQTSARKVELT